MLLRDSYSLSHFCNSYLDATLGIANRSVAIKDDVLINPLDQEVLDALIAKTG